MIKKVVLVEDDPTMKILLKTLLEIEQFSVTVVEEHSLDAISRNLLAAQPDAIILDVHIKETDGLDVLKEIRGNNLIGLTKVLMTSGEDLKHTCIKAGADGFLLKPYMPDELISWLKTH